MLGGDLVMTIECCGAPRRAQARQFHCESVAVSGQAGVGRAGDGRGLGDADHDVGRSGTDVGEVLRCNPSRLEGDRNAVFRIRVEVLEMATAVLVDVEPCAVAQRIAPRAKFREVGKKALANGVRTGRETGRSRKRTARAS